MSVRWRRSSRSASWGRASLQPTRQRWRRIARPEFLAWAAAPPVLPIAGPLIPFESEDARRGFLTEVAAWNPDATVRAFASARLADEAARREDAAQQERWRTQARRDGPESEYVKAWLERKERGGNARVQRFPIVTLQTLGGEAFGRDELRGRHTLLVFSTAGCVPCKQMIPDLQALRREYTEDELRMVTVGLDMEPAVLAQQLKAEPPQPWHHAPLDGEEGRRLFAIERVPTLLLYDEAGRLLPAPDRDLSSVSALLRQRVRGEGAR